MGQHRSQAALQGTCFESGGVTVLTFRHRASRRSSSISHQATLKRADQSIKALGALRLWGSAVGSAAGSAATWLRRAMFPPCQCHWKNWTGIDLEKSEREQQDRPFARLT